VNTNKLLRLCDGCDGGKTGSTGEAGYCVSATAKRGDMRLIAVVLGASSGKQRFAIAREMLEYGFANYRKYPVAVRGTRVKGRLPVTGGTEAGVALMLDGDLTLLMNKGDQRQIQLVPDLPESMPAPVEAGQVVGHVAVAVDGRTVAQIPVVACEAVPVKSLGIGRILQRWIAEM
jgi:D-alanyl-D-alanine carboxypeptidase (penicillin-binding protein 5/6)